MVRRVSITPNSCAWLVTIAFAVGVGAATYRIPVQVSDSLDVIEHVAASPSIATAFTEALHSSATMLRPMRQAQTKALISIVPATGAGYSRALRGFHALGAIALYVLFAAAVRPREWEEVAALAVGLTVLTGLHTSAGMFREAFPINHFLMIAIYCTATFVLARRENSSLVDALSVACFAVAALTLESGLIVLPLAVAGYAGGLRGISRRALIAMGMLALGYFALRIGYLGIHGAELGERPTGFGTGVLDGDALVARFGERPFVLYSHNVAASVLTVLFSQPIGGAWTAVRAWVDGRLVAADIIAIGTSLGATAWVLWYLSQRNAEGQRHFMAPLSLSTMTMLAGSACLSYAYAKGEIMSAAGVFYALLVVAAARHTLTTASRRQIHVAPALLVLVLTSAWSVRAIGLLYHLERAAFAARSEWVRSDHFELGAHTSTSIDSSLKREALQRVRTNPALLPRELEDLWGTP